ncbi:MAG: hypothetical protein Q7W02_00055 [Candidatus Rokubacteria bacterium]|nr:hypothetical protein [Candidatus Rokubacteria bacterium]
MRSRDTTEATRKARAQVLSGALERRVAQLDQMTWVKPGQSLELSTRARRRLAAARSLAGKDDYLDAVTVFHDAEQLVEQNRPAFREEQARARVLAQRKAAAIEGGKKVHLAAQKRARKWRRRDKDLQEDYRQKRMESSDLTIRIRRLRYRYRSERPPGAKTLRRFLK